MVKWGLTNKYIVRWVSPSPTRSLLPNKGVLTKVEGLKVKVSTKRLNNLLASWKVTSKKNVHLTKGV